MIHTHTALGGMVVAPHHLAAQAGRDVLRDGGTAVEAMVAAAATPPARRRGRPSSSTAAAMFHTDSRAGVSRPG